MSFCWFTSSIGYPNFFKTSGAEFELAEAFLTLARASLEGVPYSAAKKLFPHLHIHQVETKKAAFQEFGFLYVTPRSDQITLTPLGRYIYEQCAGINPTKRRRNDILRALCRGLMRYQFNNPLPVGGRKGLPRAVSSNVIPYLATYYLMARLDGVVTASELRGAVFGLQSMADLRECERRIRFQRETREFFPDLPSLPAQKGTADNLVIYFVSHVSLDSEIMATDSRRLFYRTPERNLVFSRPGSQLVLELLSEEWIDWRDESKPVPEAKRYSSFTEYFSEGVGQREPGGTPRSSLELRRSVPERPKQAPSFTTLRVVEDPNEIDQFQYALRRFASQQATEEIACTVGYRGGSEKASVLYWSKQDMWFYSKKIESRYWNAFGIGRPAKGRPCSITCEINIPLAGVNRQIQGAFAVDEEGEAFVIHRGGIGGGTKGIGKFVMLEKYRGKLAQLTDGIGEVTIVPVGRLGDAELALQIATFVREVYRLKQLIKRRGSFRPRKLRGFRQEFAGKRSYKVTRDVSADVNHGAVVNELARILESKKFDIDNDHRDLFIRNQRGKVSVLFEAKTNFDSSSVHSAIGQLYYYSVDEGQKPRLVAILPTEIPNLIVGKLKKLGVEVLKYQLRPNRVAFIDLPDYA